MHFLYTIYAINYFNVSVVFVIYRYHCGYNYVFDESDLISTLPPYLQNDVHSFLARTILMQMDIFKSIKKNLEILGQISLKMRSISCNENFKLFKKNDRAKEIYTKNR